MPILPEHTPAILTTSGRARSIPAMSFIQEFGAVCGNGHVITDMLPRPVDAGTVPGVPKLCPECSAPISTRCPASGCGEAILGRRNYPGVILTGRQRVKPWFCHACGTPYIWATPEQIRQWVENRLKFDDSIEEDVQDQLLEVLAVLTPGEPEAPPMDFSAFRNLLKQAPQLYEQVKPFVPMLRELF
jgi:hypothetical protein